MIYSASLSNHITHLQLVLECLQSNQFFVKLSKCHFCQTSIEYLSHIVDAKGVHADPKKIEAMVNWPTITNLKQLRGFLGLTGYYRRFVRGYVAIAAPLTELLKKDAFCWSQATESAFQALKHAMSDAPVLHLPNFELPFIIETDASNVG